MLLSLIFALLLLIMCFEVAKVAKINDANDDNDYYDDDADSSETDDGMMIVLTVVSKHSINNGNRVKKYLQNTYL